jgi:hypothetical protein
MKRSILTRSILSVMALHVAAQAQFEVKAPDALERVKDGTVYLAMKDPTTEKAKPFIDALREGWKLSKVDVIRYADIPSRLAPGASFLTFDGYVTTTQSMTMYADGSTRYGVKAENSYVYLSLWTCNPKKFKDGKAPAEDDVKVPLARVELYPDFPTLADPRNIYNTDADADGHLRNWTPGLLRSQLMTLSAYLQAGKKRSRFDGEEDIAALARLKTDTLYVPDYALVKFSAFTGDESKRHDAKDIFEDYPFAYRVMPVAELDAKLRTDANSFLYLSYVKSSTDKFVSVYDSRDGRMVYSDYSPTSYNIGSGDLKRLAKIIRKAK